MDHVIDNEPCFSGQVEEETRDYVVVASNDIESIYEDYPIVHTSLDVEQADSYVGFLFVQILRTEGISILHYLTKKSISIFFD